MECGLGSRASLSCWISGSREGRTSGNLGLGLGLGGRVAGLQTLAGVALTVCQKFMKEGEFHGGVGTSVLSCSGSKTKSCWRAEVGGQRKTQDVNQVPAGVELCTRCP